MNLYVAPNWKDAKLYENPWVENGTVQENAWWKWQFLRRRVEYRAAWDSCRGEGLDCLWGLSLPYGFRIEKPTGFLDIACMIFGEDHYNHPFTQFSFGLNYLLNPSIEFPTLSMWNDTVSQGAVKSIGVSTGYRRHEDGVFRYPEIDLSKDVHLQLDLAKKWLLKHQAKLGLTQANKKPTTGTMARSLRVIDAAESGATNREIGSVIESFADDPVAKAKRWKAEAKRLQDRLAPILSLPE